MTMMVPGAARVNVLISNNLFMSIAIITLLSPLLVIGVHATNTKPTPTFVSPLLSSSPSSSQKVVHHSPSSYPTFLLQSQSSNNNNNPISDISATLLKKIPFLEQAGNDEDDSSLSEQDKTKEVLSSLGMECSTEPKWGYVAPGRLYDIATASMPVSYFHL